MLKFINLKNLTALSFMAILAAGLIAQPATANSDSEESCNSNNGHGNNAATNITLTDGTRIAGTYDPSNSGNSAGNQLTVTNSQGNTIEYGTLNAAQLAEFNNQVHDLELHGRSSGALGECVSYLDTDGDGIYDVVEGGYDTDGDNIQDYADTDSDGDGILDSVEGLYDNDNDGIANYLDLDSDGDGILDSAELIYDYDNDGIASYLDLDSDGDGINDSLEGTNDSDNDGIADYVDNIDNTNNSVNSNNDDVFGLQLRYLDSAFQCSSDGDQANISVYVYDTNNNLLTTMSKGDTYTSADIDSVQNLKFRYQFNNVTCPSWKYYFQPSITTYSSNDDNQTQYYWNNKYNVASNSVLLGSQDSVPNVGGAYNQAPITRMLVGLDSYEKLLLVELGTSGIGSVYHDLQDVVLVVDNNPDSLANADNDLTCEETDGCSPPLSNPDTNDADNNGIPDAKEFERDGGSETADLDNDGVPNYQDLDDDGDNIPDVMELYTPSAISSTGTKSMTPTFIDKETLETHLQPK